MSSPLDVHPELARRLFGSGRDRAHHRRLAAKAHLRAAQRALQDGDTAKALEHLEIAQDRLRRAQELEAMDKAVGQ